MTLTWTLAICTYNRRAELLETLGLALAQTRPPVEAIIVDASPDWAATRDMALVLADRHGVAMRYEKAAERSLTNQRNQAIGLAAGDVLFLIDDDSFLFPDSAAAVMDIYEADPDGAVAAIGLAATATNPSSAATGLQRKQTGHEVIGAAGRVPLLRGAVRWLYTKVLMMRHEETFISYDAGGFGQPAVPPTLAAFDVHAVNHIPGYSMTVRRAVALKEPFDPLLRYYAALEDADATHRFRRHGALLVARQARVHHFQTSASRLPRDKVIILQLLNLAIFLRRHATALPQKRREYHVMLWRRLVAEFFKDLLSQRFALPQVSGVRYVMGMWREVFDRPAADIFAWYPDFQRRLIEDNDYVAWPSDPSGLQPASTRS